jgi:hypothetical protein
MSFHPETLGAQKLGFSWQNIASYYFTFKADSA